MRLRNQELMEEFYNRNLSKFPGLTLEQSTTICHTQFQFLRQCIEKDEITEIRLKYFGSFQVFPGRAKNYLYNLKDRLKFHKIEPLQYKRLSTMVENYLKTQKQDGQTNF